MAFQQGPGHLSSWALGTEKLNVATVSCLVYFLPSLHSLTRYQYKEPGWASK